MNDKIQNNPRTAKSGIGVTASPFNGVKLELALILIIGITLGLVLNHMLESDTLQMLVLAGYGVVASIWIILRTRSLARAHHECGPGHKSDG